MKAYTVLAAAAIAVLLGGCASTMTADQKAKMDAAEHMKDADRLVQGKIADSTASIANTLQLIERIERGPANPRATSAVAASNAPMANAMANQAAGGGTAPAATQVAGGSAVSTNGPASQTGQINDMLDSRLRIQWRNGSAEELLRSLATKMGVPFKVIGERRPLPPVSVVSDNESMRWILDAVGHQVDRSADIVMNKSQQPAVLELRFK